MHISNASQFPYHPIDGEPPSILWDSALPSGDAYPYKDVAIGSICVVGSTTKATIKQKQADNNADADWLGLSFLSGTGVINNALLLGGGTAASPNTTSTANKNFIEFRGSTTATTAGSDTRMAYLRLYMDGATTGGGDCLRAFTTVNAAVGTVQGTHSSVNFGASGAISGQAVAVRSTLHLPDGAAPGGTLAPLQAEVWSDGDDSDPAGATLHYLRFVNGGNANGIADVDDDINLFSIEGHTIGSGNLVVADTDETKFSHKIRISIGGSAYYLMATAT